LRIVFMRIIHVMSRNKIMAPSPEIAAPDAAQTKPTFTGLAIYKP
jgi:hypothetical protein